MGKRDYGEGGYYHNKRGEWFAFVPLGNGKRKVTRAKNEADAKAIWKQLLKDRDAGIDLAAKSQTVAAFLHLWLDEVARPNVKPKTAHFYQQIITFYIVPGVGDMYLDKLQPQHALALLNGLRGRVSSRTIRHVYTVARTAFTVATRWGRIQRNPFMLIDPPRVQHASIQPLTLDEGRRVLAAASASPLAPLYQVELLYGLRKGELLGLLRADLDCTNATIRVTQQVQEVAGKVRIETPKSRYSVRTLPLPQPTVTMLQHHLSSVPLSDFLFPSEAGTAIQTHNLNRHFKMLLARAELPATVRFHDLRHSVATWLTDAGTPQPVVSAVLGHHVPGVTGIYAHATMQAMRAAVERLYTMLMAS